MKVKFESIIGQDMGFILDKELLSPDSFDAACKEPK